jgi:enamine deaminase RidA (YjgF/YER057c/UK114 family)
MDKEVFGVDGTGPKAGRFLTRAVKANGLVFTTLHHGFDPADYDPTIEAGTLPDDIGTQMRFALEELGKVLAEAGSSIDRALKVNVYVNSPEVDALDRANAAFDQFFAERRLSRPPVRTSYRGGLVDVGVAADLVAAA